jgi:tetratricopeptide (TPR) repeat protein
MMNAHANRSVFSFLLAVLLCPMLFTEACLAQSPSKSDSRAGAASQNSVTAVEEEGRRALVSGEYVVAERDYKQLLTRGVHSAAVYSDLGVVYMRTGRLDPAIKAFLEAKALAPGVVGVRLNLGLAYFRKHEFKPAAGYFTDVLVSDPNNVQAGYLKGICEFMLDDFAKAVAAFEPLRNQEGADLDYLFMLGTSYGMLHRTEDSLRVFEQMVEVGGDTPHLHLLLGKAYLALGQNDKAGVELQSAAESGALPFAHYYLGALRRQQGQTELAAAEFEREIASNPVNRSAYKDLGEIRLEEEDDPQAAVALLEKGVTNCPDAPELFALLGRAYLKVSNTENALTALRKAVALSPNSSTYHYQLARAYLKAGRHDEANAEMNRARHLASEAPEGKMQAISKEQSIEADKR